MRDWFEQSIGFREATVSAQRPAAATGERPCPPVVRRPPALFRLPSRLAVRAEPPDVGSMPPKTCAPMMAATVTSASESAPVDQHSRWAHDCRNRGGELCNQTTLWVGRCGWMSSARRRWSGSRASDGRRTSRQSRTSTSLTDTSDWPNITGVAVATTRQNDSNHGPNTISRLEVSMARRSRPRWRCLVRGSGCEPMP